MSAPQKSEYKIITGNFSQIQNELNTLAPQNWKPILMSTNQVQGSSPGPVAITVILEHVLGT